MSGFDTVNAYNGNLNFRLPLAQMAGRGEAGYTAMLALNTKRWHVRRSSFFVNNEETNITWTPTNSNWNPREVGYGPGTMLGRQIGVFHYDCNPQLPAGQKVYKYTLTTLTFTAADGTEYELRDKETGGQPQKQPQSSVTFLCNNPFANGPARGKVFVTADGSAATFISDDPIYDKARTPTGSSGRHVYYPYGVLKFRDGTTYRIEDGLVMWIRDRNGNRTRFSYGGNRIASATDSLNRQITFAYQQQEAEPYGLCDRITFNGFGGEPRIIRISKTNLGSVLRSGYSLMTYALLFPQLNGSGNYEPNTYDQSGFVSRVWLPEGDGRSYRFFYNPYGELARVELPTGGAFEYDYTPASGVRQGNIGMGDDWCIYRRVKERRILADGSNVEGKTIWRQNANFDFTGFVDQVDPNDAVLATSSHSFYGDPVESLYTPFHWSVYSDWQEGREVQTSALLGSVQVRRTHFEWRQRETLSWVGWWAVEVGQVIDPANDPRLLTTTTTLVDTNQVSKQTSCPPTNPTCAPNHPDGVGFDQYNNQTDSCEYDFGSGSPGELLRHTHTAYKTSGYDTVVGGTSAPDPIATIHIRNLPETQTVKDANGVIRAKTTYEYDGSSLGTLENYGSVAIPGLVSRDGLTQAEGYNPANDLARGNVTRVTRWLLANTGLVAQETGLHTESRYDVAGNVVKVRDAKGYETTLDYSDSFNGAFTPNTFAFLKSATSPTPSTGFGGGQALVSTSVYDFQSGKVVLTRDPNNRETTLEYNDPLDRLTRVVRPTGGGETVFAYGFGDAAANRFIHTKTKQSSGPDVWVEDYGFYDGLGRTWRSAHVEGSDYFSVRDSQFDALGRANKVANPYFFSGTFNQLVATGASNTNLTITTFDALGRATKVTTPDGSHVDTAYLGNKVTVTDQAGKSRSSITDGLGRLIQVNEDPNALNYQTNYTYDVLGNLIRVRQGGFPTGGSSDPTVQFRRFYYDSLSRLAFANNPEQDATIPFDPPIGPGVNESGVKWTMKYEYDANGNLTKRTDARGVETTYGYDALNRNTTVDYNLGTSGAGPTPAVRRYYDVATSGDGGGTFQNGKGRLRRVETSSQNHPNSGAPANSRTVIDSYDNLGRITSQKQGFQTGGNWQHFTTSRLVSPTISGYDLVGHVVSQIYPSGNTVGYLYGADGRLSEFNGLLGNQGGSAFTKQISYDAAGQMLRERFETQLPDIIYHHMRYNNRFQMIETSVGTSSDASPENSGNWDRGKLRFFYNKQALTTEEPNSDPSAMNDGNNGNVLRQEHWVPTTVGQKKTEEGNLPVVVNYAVPMRDDYAYDTINRLIKVEGRQRQTGAGTPQQIYQQAYSYDKFGNRKLDAAQTSGNLITGTQPADLYDINKPTNRLTGMLYDAAGNLRSALSNLRFDRRDYDAENRMIYAKTGINPGSYVYDGDGRRVRRIVNGVETWQVYGIDGELLAEYNATSGSPVLLKEYGYRNGQLLVVTEASPATVKWLVADHLGTPRIIVDSTGSLTNVRRHDYLPFGEELTVGMGGIQSGAVPIRSVGMGYAADGVRQKFGAKERDTETGLSYFLTRYFSSVQGRFTSPDEIFADQYEHEPQSWNLYTYVANNPLKYADPTGLWKQYIENGQTYYIAEEGDTLESLAKLLGTSTRRVVSFFDGVDKVEVGVYYGVTDLVGQLDQERNRLKEMLKEINDGWWRNEIPLPEERFDPRSPWTRHYPAPPFSFPRNPSNGRSMNDLLSPNKLAKGKHEQRKPGKLGQFKGSDALRAENKLVRDVAKKLKLTPEQRRQLHDEISGEGLNYQEILQRARDLFDQD